MRTDLRSLLDTNVVTNIGWHPSGLCGTTPHRGWRRVRRNQHRGRVRDPLRPLAKSGAHRVVNRLTQVLAKWETLALEPPVDEHYGDIRNRLQRAGRSIGPNDLLIAAHARALGLTLVTDVREFSRVPDLAVENWLATDV